MDDWLYIAIIAALAAAVLALCLRCRALRRRLERRERVMAPEDDFKLFASYAFALNEDISGYDVQGGVRIRYSFEDGALKSDASPSAGEPSFLETLHPDDRESARAYFAPEALRRVTETGGVVSFEARAEGGDGWRWKRFVLQGSPQNLPGHPASYRVFTEDVHEFKHREETIKQNLRDALMTAEHASQAKGSFMSRMSHEIRTPLNAIIGYMTLAQGAEESREQVMDYISKSNSAARHLLSVINDVLDISSIDSGRMKLGYERFDLKELIASLISVFFAQCDAKGVHFEVVLDQVINERLVGDALRLKQILMNLLSNAVKFTPEGGSVTLTLTETTHGGRGAYFTFTVADTGIGMSPEYLTRIWTPFEQESAKTAVSYGGTGLGLSITKNLVTMMQGKISVSSVMGKGSTFMVKLSFDLDEQEAESAPSAPDYSHLRILIVDDDKSTCEFVAMFVRRCGIRAEYVTSGQQALDAVAEAIRGGQPFDLCFMDWKMPGMDGLETARRLRSLCDGGMVTVILSAYDVVGIESEARAAGVTKLIAKPLFQSTLLDAIASIYGQLPSAEPSRPKTWHFDGARVLLAEDNVMNREIARALLVKAGLTVDCAVNGQEAVEMFTKSAPCAYSIILMDIQMPLLNGRDATVKIRASSHADAKTVPIIAMTADAFAEDVAASLAAGMDDHISKPIDVQALYMTIDKHIKRHMAAQPPGRVDFDRYLGIVGSDGAASFGLVIYKNGAEIERRMTGYQDAERRVLVTERTMYRMRSAARPMTAVAALQLVERGLIALDTPVFTVFPEFAKARVREPDGTLRPPATPVTVSHLLTMTAGVARALDGSEPETAADRARAVAGVPLRFDPGTRWELSLCDDVLAGLVEVVADMPFAQYAREHIFAPCGMTDSCLRADETILPRLAAPDAQTRGGVCLIATVSDAARFCETLRRGGLSAAGERVLREETVALMTQNHLTGAPFQTFSNGLYRAYGYGFGVRVRLRDGEHGVPPEGEFGWDEPGGAYALADRKNGLTMCFARQGADADAPDLHGTLQAAAYRLVAGRDGA